MRRLYNSPFRQLLQGLPPEQVACVHQSKALTAEELLVKSEELASYLQSKGINRGSRVLMATAPGNEFLILFFALLHLRALTAIIDPHMGNEHYRAKLKQFNPEFAFIDSRILLLQEHPVLRWIYHKLKPAGFYISPPENCRVFRCGMYLPLLRSHNKLKYSKASREFENPADEDDFLVVYTSGTLSSPKGVVHSIGGLYRSLKDLSAVLRKVPVLSIATHLPQFAIIGLLSGFKTHFWKENSNPAERIKFIEKNNINLLFGPPAEFQAVLDYCETNGRNLPANLLHLVFGSAPVPVQFLKKVRSITKAKISCLYGMTENLLIAYTDGDDKIADTEQGDLLGKIFHSVETLITDEGELLIRSPYLFSHYYGKPPEKDLHPTGDLVRQINDQIYMLGRKKNMIIRGDKNIYPGLYEETIRQNPEVRDAVMVGVYDDHAFDEKLYLLVELSAPLTEKSLRERLKKGKTQIDSDVWPDVIIFTKIPRKGRQFKTDYTAINQLISPISKSV